VYKRLGLVVAAVEIASVAALLFLLGQPGLPAKFGLVLVFGLPISFGLHVCEEFFFPGGGAAWFRLARPESAQVYTEGYFFWINAIPLGLAFLVTLGTFDFAGGYSFFGIRAWLAFLCFQAIQVVLFHLMGTIRLRRYSPGMVTNILLYLPLTVTAFVYLLRTGTVDPISAVVCIAVGFAIVAVIGRVRATSARAPVTR
jgi:hypothetical protein